MLNEISDLCIARLLEQWGYEKPCIIGEGGFAKVYRVRKQDAGAVCVCKVSCKKEMLGAEAGILRQLKHPLFAAYLDYKESETLGFLFMEYIPGQTLGTLIKRRKKMSQRRVIEIGMALAEGLCYLHEQPVPIIFRDLKPENIMLREDGTVKLLDLGSALWGNASLRVLTGTKGYSAPEQWTDTESIGAYSDVYALGRVLLFLLGDGKTYYGVFKLLESAVREERRERIPDMRCFYHQLKPYASNHVRSIVKAEMQALLYGKCSNYIFLQNIVKY